MNYIRIILFDSIWWQNFSEESKHKPIEYFSNWYDTNSHKQSKTSTNLRKKIKDGPSIGFHILGNMFFRKKDVDNSDIFFKRIVIRVHLEFCSKDFLIFSISSETLWKADSGLDFLKKPILTEFFAENITFILGLS